MYRHLMAITASALVALLFFLPQQAFAAPDVTIDTTAGLQNKVKSEKGLPIQFTISNNGSAFSGDLVLSYSESYRLGAGLAVPVEVAAGETKTIQIASPGLSENYYSGGQSSQQIFLFEGGWEEGNSVDFNGSKELQPSFLPPTSLFVATLTDNPDRLMQLGQTSFAGSGAPEVVHLNQMNQFELPSEALAWQMVDYLVIDEYAYSDLPEAVQQAVLEWVQQGGHVVVGSTENIAAEMGNFSDYLPLELGSVREVSIPSLENAVPAYEATASEESEVVLENDGNVLAARQQVGAGTVTQTSFSLGDEMVSQQSGYPELMGNFFEINTASSGPMQGQTSKEYIANELGSVNELFESFAVSKTLIMTVIILYILLIIPVLYTVLKKKDRLEYAWGIIPAVAILTSVGLFAAGAKDRIANPQIQQTGFFEVNPDNGLNGYYMNSLLSNRGGDYQFTASSSTTMTQLFSSGLVDELPHQTAVLERQASGSALTLRDVQYWSVSSITGQSHLETAGSFDVRLEIENQTITGTIQSNFPFAVEDAAIWTGTRLLTLGNLSPGQQLTVNETIQTDILSPASAIGQSYGFQPIANTAELEEARRQALLSASYEQLSEGGNAPYLIAYTKDAIVPVTLEEQRASMSSLHLIAQSFDPLLEGSGDVTLAADAFDLEVTPKDLASHFQNVSQDPYFYFFDDGDYEVTYTLPSVLKGKETHWEELSVEIARSNAAISILNHETSEFEEMPAGDSSFAEKADRYISEEGSIEFSLKMNAGSGSPEMELPKIELKGGYGLD